MKRLTCMISLCALVGALAQVASDFRIIDGTLYNVQKSPWIDIPPRETYSREFAYTVSYSGKVASIGQSGLLVRIEVQSRFNTDKNEWNDRIVLIKHHPKQKTFTDGDNFPQDRFFPLGNQTLTNRAGERVMTVRAYDYGLPNTPENRAKPKKQPGQ